MQQPSAYTAFLDSSVLFPVFTSNLLLFMSESELFRVRWSADVHREWIDSRMEKFPDADRARLESKQARMDREFPNALVTGYESLIDDYDLADKADRHIVAAAVKGCADVIVTNNPDDFPSAKLPDGLLVQTADQFVCDQFDLDSTSGRLIALALIRHKKSLTRSRPSWTQYLQILAARLPDSFEIVSSGEFRQLIAEALSSREWEF